MSTSRDESGRPQSRVLIGTIVGAHGVKGTLRIHPLTDYPERFLHMKVLHVERLGAPSRELAILSASRHVGKGQVLVTVAGITDRDGAEALAGYVVTVAQEERVSLSEGEYWIDSLIGLAVINEANEERLGVIEDVMSTGSSDLYLVRTEAGEEKMLPAIEDVVREIDVNGGFVRVCLIEGLWD